MSDDTVEPKEVKPKKPRKPRAKKTTAPGKRGRPKTKPYLPYAEAVVFVRDQNITSVLEFQKWHDKEKPAVIPRWPHRVYIKDWTTWNNFLGTSNTFETARRKWRGFEDACEWARALKLETAAAWTEYVKNNTIPTDIPKRPDLTYKTWRTWGYFLGNKPEAVVEVKQQQALKPVFYIVREGGDINKPGNIYRFEVEPQGLRYVYNKWKREQFEIIKLFWFEDAQTEVVRGIINSLSSSYQSQDRVRIVPNIYEILWRLQTLFVTISDPLKELETLPVDTTPSVFD